MTPHSIARFAALIAFALLAQPAYASAPTLDDDAPAVVVGEPGTSLVTPRVAVAADHAIASRVGGEVLRRGGNAVDAAVAVGLTLGVVNPFASGLGGGGFLLVRTAEGEVEALDFREAAPGAAHRDMYVVDGEVDRALSLVGGLAVGVPGEAAGWWAVHERYGRLPWADVVAPALSLARDGFEAGTLLESRLDSNTRLEASPALASHFSSGEGYVRAGERVVRAGLGEALRAYAEQGPSVFYEGWVAEDIVAAVEAAGGVMTMADLAGYTPRWLEPVESTYRGATVYGMPTPSSGGLVVALVLDVLAAFELDRLHYDDAAFAHLIMHTLAHAFADRAHYLGDHAFADVPFDRFRGEARRREVVESYDPVRVLEASDYGALAMQEEEAGTSHFSIVDDEGMAVACTVTINTSFGSMVLTERSQIVLNNEMDDFASQPGVPNVFGLVGSEANAIAPGKRPLSSMSPTIVVDDEGVLGVLGGSGGPRIITGTLLALIQLIDFDSDAMAAVSAPRFHHQWLPFRAFVEETGSRSWRERLVNFGYEVEVQPFGSAVQVVWRHGEGWQAASDPRKHGVPAGW